jgi:hypothetical protein
LGRNAFWGNERGTDWKKIPDVRNKGIMKIESRMNIQTIDIYL